MQHEKPAVAQAAVLAAAGQPCSTQTADILLSVIKVLKVKKFFFIDLRMIVQIANIGVPILGSASKPDTCFHGNLN